MTSSNKPAPADTAASAQTTTGSATPTEVSSPTQTAAARTAAQGGDTGIISPTDAAFSADDLAEIEQADSPYYQLSSRITQLLGEREIVGALGNTERVYAVDKELGEMRRVWDDRDTTTEARGTPPEGRQTLRERQIRAGSGPVASAPPPQRPAPATSTTAAGTTASGEDTATTPTTSTTSGAAGGKSSPASAPTSGSTSSTSTAATPTTTGGSEAKP
jgi:hypothetical protein